MLHWGLLAAAHRLPFLPIRAGLGSDVLRVNPDLRTVGSPYARGGTGRHARAAARRRADPPQPGRRRAATAQYLGPDPYFDDLFCLAAERSLPVLRADRADRRAAGGGPAAEPAGQPGHGDGVVEAPAARTSPAACPTTAATRRSRPSTRPAAKDPEAWQRFPAEYLAGDEAAYQEAVGGAVAARTRPRERRPEQPGAGRRAREPPGPRCAWSRAPRRGAATARSWPAHGPDPEPRRPAGPAPRSRPTCCCPTARRYLLAPGDSAAGAGRGLAALPLGVHDRGLARRAAHDDGRRQIDRYGNKNISCIGDWARPRAQLLGVRGAPGNTVNHPVSYWVPRHSPPRVRRAGRHGLRHRLRPRRGRGPRPRASTSCAWWSPTWRCWTSGAADHAHAAALRAPRGHASATSSPPPGSRWSSPDEVAGDPAARPRTSWP